jgi:hypothetical protein
MVKFDCASKPFFVEMHQYLFLLALISGAIVFSRRYGYADMKLKIQSRTMMLYYIYTTPDIECSWQVLGT